MREGRVSLWHPWLDKPGIRHTPVLWNNNSFPRDIERLIDYVAQGKQYVFCNDILDPLEIPIELINHPKSEAYLGRTGRVVALRVKSKKTSGFFIPGHVWDCKSQPDERLLKNVHRLFTLFGYDAITPSSLSERVLRGTLPEKTFIARPSHMVRAIFLANSIGGRIDECLGARYFKKAFVYDENKSYLAKAREGVPTPFRAPIYLYYGEHGRQNQYYRAFPTSYVHVHFTCHGTGVHPIQVSHDGRMCTPLEGEIIDRWMWIDELDDCLEQGYTLNHVEEAYCWRELSRFMTEWSDILWDKFEKEQNRKVQDLIKQMMVGLPGRFLKSPEIYTLVHEKDYCKGDMPILAQWEPGNDVTTPWFIRAEFDMESAQLTPIGDYIRMKCRQELYHHMKTEEQRGNEVLSAYIDSYTVAQKTKQKEMLGKEPGQWKEKVYRAIWIVENQLIPEDIKRMRAPGVTGIERQKLHERYHPS